MNKQLEGIELIAQERKEQIEKHGRTIEQDYHLNCDGQLWLAASCLSFKEIDEWDPDVNTPSGWDQGIWENMVRKTHKERLIIAGALIAAELDRLNHLKKLDNND